MTLKMADSQDFGDNPTHGFRFKRLLFFHTVESPPKASRRLCAGSGAEPVLKRKGLVGPLDLARRFPAHRSRERKREGPGFARNPLLHLLPSPSVAMEEEPEGFAREEDLPW
jgi:hypothetical protein